METQWKSDGQMVCELQNLPGVITTYFPPAPGVPSHFEITKCGKLLATKSNDSGPARVVFTPLGRRFHRERCAGRGQGGSNSNAAGGTMTTYYVKQIEKDWQPIEAESVEAAATKYVAEYTDRPEGSIWIDLAVRGPEGQFFFPRLEHEE